MIFRKKQAEPAAKPAPAPAAVTPPPAETSAAPPADSGTPALRTSLGPDAEVTGKLSFNVPTRLDGRLKGEVRASDLLLIGRQAFVDGGVFARELIVEGEVHGDVKVDRRVEVTASGRIFGNIRAGVLVIEPGGLINGDCRIKP